jgi:hypothetical protein
MWLGGALSWTLSLAWKLLTAWTTRPAPADSARPCLAESQEAPTFTAAMPAVHASLSARS